MEVEEWIQKSVRRGPGARTGTLTLPALFQGWPQIAHGGGVLACLDALARPALPDGPHLVSPHVVSVKLHRSVDLETPLTWQLTSLDGGVGLTLHQEERCLVEGSVRIAPAAEPVPAGLPPQAGESEAPTVPGNANCLACGSENPIGLQIRFHYGEGAVWKSYRPRPHYRAADGSLVPAFHFIALDEIGWWLGVLGAGECGVTNEITVRILRPVPFDTPLVISGSRAAVTPDDDRGRLWRAQATVSADGTPVAVGSVRFAGSRGFTRRLIPGFLASSSPEDVRRLFPRYFTPRAMEDAS
jgi:hypothetical protein